MLNVVNFGGGTYVLYAEIDGDEIEVDPDTYGDNFARPARLLPLEAKALVAAIDLFGDHLPQAGLSTAREKIVAALGHDPSEEGLEIAPGRRRLRGRPDRQRRDRAAPGARAPLLQGERGRVHQARGRALQAGQRPRGLVPGLLRPRPRGHAPLPARPDEGGAADDGARSSPARGSTSAWPSRSGWCTARWQAPGSPASGSRPERARWLREERSVVEELADGARRGRAALRLGRLAGARDPQGRRRPGRARARRRPRGRAGAVAGSGPSARRPSSRARARRAARPGRAARRRAADGARLAEPVDPHGRQAHPAAGSMSWKRLAPTCTCVAGGAGCRRRSAPSARARACRSRPRGGDRQRRRARRAPRPRRRAGRGRCSRGSPASSRARAARPARAGTSSKGGHAGQRFGEGVLAGRGQLEALDRRDTAARRAPSPRGSVRSRVRLDARLDRVVKAPAAARVQRRATAPQTRRAGRPPSRSGSRSSRRSPSGRPSAARPYIRAPSTRRRATPTSSGSSPPTRGR